MKVTVREQPAWVMYDLRHLGTDACQPPIEITALLYHSHQAHPKTASSHFGREAHACQSSLEIIDMLYCGRCHLQHAFLLDHSTKKTPGSILAKAATKYSLIKSSNEVSPNTMYSSPSNHLHCPMRKGNLGVRPNSCTCGFPAMVALGFGRTQTREYNSHICQPTVALRWVRKHAREDKHQGWQWSQHTVDHGESILQIQAQV